jgi:hypothetical protein
VVVVHPGKYLEDWSFNMGNCRNLAGYVNKNYQMEAEFVFTGTSALKRGHGMCYDLSKVTTETGQTATDSWGRRALKEVAVPSSSNNMAFAGVLTQDYPADANGKLKLVKLALPGGTAMIAQAATSVINTGLLTCAVCEDDSGDTTLANGLFGYGGFEGRGSAIPLTTLAVADEGDMPMQEIKGDGVSVYSSTTGLTTITCDNEGTPGTYMGYASVAVDADEWEAVVWGGGVE